MFEIRNLSIRTFLSLGFALVAMSSLPGCLLVAAGGAGAAGGYVLGQEESPGDQLKDTSMRSEISQSWVQYNFDLSKQLDATVYEGRVLVTGRVMNEDWHQEAIRRTWQVKGVKEVYDEVQVGPDTHFSDDARDTLITTRLRNDLIWDSQIRSVNYSIKTENAVVYVIGSARSQTELDRVTDYARNIANVRRVVSYVRIRTGQPADTQPASAPAANSPATATAATPAPAPSTPTASPTPRNEIQVQPLQ